MTPEQIRIAVAQECGWVRVDVPPNSPWEASPGTGNKIWWHPHQLPHYEEDLNAINEASSWVEDRKWSDYLMHVIQDKERCGAVEARYKTAKATALQRAEAFLRTKCKWIEG